MPPDFWPLLEALCDRLARSAEPGDTLPEALQFILQNLQRASGLIVIQPAGAAAPRWLIHQQLPEAYLPQLTDPNSELRQFAQRLGAGEQPAFPAGVGAAQPIRVETESLGALILFGPAAAAAETEWLAYAARGLGRAVRLHQLHTASQERQLEAALAQAEKLVAVGQLTADMAHEINNPLTAILANAQLLQRALPPEPDWQASLSLILRAGDRAQRIVRNLLDFSRQAQYEFSLTDINESIQSALGLVDYQLRHRSINLVCHLAPDLPRLPASHDHLQGVWLNLLLNARDAVGPAGGEISVSTAVQADCLLVTITDTGAGIPPEQLTRIFEPFYTTKLPGQGTGLGLSLCQRIVRQHGGSIRVDSQPGQGTTFTVALPLKRK